VFCFGRRDETIEFARGALANFRSAFDADAEAPSIRGGFFLKRGRRRLGSIFFGFEEELHELRADEIYGCGAKGCGLDKFAKRESVFRGVKRDDEAVARWRGRKSAEVEASDDRESAESADEKFVEVVAGDVFDDAATAFAEAACAVHKFRADEEVAGGSVRMAKRRIYAGSNDAADGRFEIKRDGKREKLFLLVERSGEVVEIGASVHADREIARIIVGDLVEGGHVHSDVVAGGRHPDRKFGAMAARDEREFFAGGEADDFGDLLGGKRLGDRGGNDFIDGVL